MEYKNFYFETADGDMFFVVIEEDGTPQKEQLAEAIARARHFFGGPKCFGWVTDEVADEWGFDTY